ncbi:MAG: hypothetical protein WAO71_16080, partial [Gallionella sp.]
PYFRIGHVAAQCSLKLPADDRAVCLSFHLYPIPTPTLPLKGRESYFTHCKSHRTLITND